MILPDNKKTVLIFFGIFFVCVCVHKKLSCYTHTHTHACTHTQTTKKCTGTYLDPMPCPLVPIKAKIDLKPSGVNHWGKKETKGAV